MAKLGFRIPTKNRVLRLTRCIHAHYLFLEASVSLSLKEKNEGGKKEQKRLKKKKALFFGNNWNHQTQIAGKLLKPVSLIICVLKMGNKTTYLVICFPLTSDFFLILPKLLCEYSTHTSWDQHCSKDSLVSL